MIVYMDKNSFFYHIKTFDFHKDIIGDVERRSYTSGYTLKIMQNYFPLERRKKYHRSDER